MAEQFINSVALVAKLLAELDVETMSVPPPPKVSHFIYKYLFISRFVLMSYFISRILKLRRPRGLTCVLES